MKKLFLILLPLLLVFSCALEEETKDPAYVGKWVSVRTSTNFDGSEYELKIIITATTNGFVWTEYSDGLETYEDKGSLEVISDSSFKLTTTEVKQNDGTYAPVEDDPWTFTYKWEIIDGNIHLSGTNTFDDGTSEDFTWILNKYTTPEYVGTWEGPTTFWGTPAIVTAVFSETTYEFSISVSGMVVSKFKGILAAYGNNYDLYQTHYTDQDVNWVDGEGFKTGSWSIDNNILTLIDSDDGPLELTKK